MTESISNSSTADNASLSNLGFSHTLIICCSLAVGVLAILLVAFHFTRRFRFSRLKNYVSTTLNRDDPLSRPWQAFQAYRESFGDSPCEFVADTISLIAVRNRVEVAFPELGTSSIQTSSPLSFLQASSYFEMEVMSCQPKTNLYFGLASKSLHVVYTPGHLENSIGYGSKDGQLYRNGELVLYSSEFNYTMRDVVGCGYFPSANVVIFTKNGLLIACLPFTTVSDASLFPALSSYGSSIVRCNFGQKRFVYREANQNAWGLGVYSSIQVDDFPIPPPLYQPGFTGVSPPEL